MAATQTADDAPPEAGPLRQRGAGVCRDRVDDHGGQDLRSRGDAEDRARAELDERRSCEIEGGPPAWRQRPGR